MQRPPVKSIKPALRAGFTLIEMAIVLVIIGLIVGGVLVGQSLIYAAQLRATVSDIEKIKTAIYTFYDKYGGLPGDLTNAYNFWGAACGPNGANGTNNQQPTDPNACNGNGNGFIEVAGSFDRGESLKAWQHLTLAGLIPGRYAGAGLAASGYFEVPGVVVPAGRLSATAYDFFLVGSPAPWPPDIYGTTGNFIRWSAYSLSNLNGDGGYGIGGGIMMPSAAKAFDLKFDDGNPATGYIRAAGGDVNGSGQPNCTSNLFAGGPTSTTYLSPDVSADCIIFFKGGY